MTYQDKLIELAKEDRSIFILTAENRASIRNLPEILPQQFADTGIAEQTLIGVAAGMALRGKKPIVHALATFLTMRAFEFIRTDIGIPSLPVKIVGSVPGFLSEANGPTHQAIEDISIMRSIPGMKIFCPSDEEDLINGLSVIMRDPSPYYIRFNSHPSKINHSPFEIGKGEIIKEPKDITILTYGFLLNEALNAADILKEDGYPTGIINMRMMEPVDTELLLAVTIKSSLIVVLEDHLIRGGLFTILSEVLTAQKVVKDILPICLTKWFRPALLKDILIYEEFDGASIAGKIKSYYEMMLIS